MKTKLVFATNNKHKLEEVRKVVKNKFEILSLEDIGCQEDIEEPGETLEENAFIKARYVKQNYGYDCFGDDTGLEVEALNGAPGVRSARYGGDHDSEANIKRLLRELDGKKNRGARFRTVIALILDGKEYQFDGIAEGEIIEEKKGTTGFGYDPVFKPTGYNNTYAELGDDVKADISHRARATKQLCEFLEKYE